MATRSKSTYTILCLLVGAALVVLYLTAPMLQTFFTLPSINDITTDLEDPPAFVILDVPPYPRDFADQQRQGYPDLGPLVIDQPVAAAFGKARDVAVDMGLMIQAAEAAEGRIEAVATTKLLHFNDDVVIRLRPEGAGTRVDMRSRSRVGRHDLGTNAKRIAEFLDRLQR